MTIQAYEFKAKCLALLDEVQRTGRAIRITKRGKVVARLVPDTQADDKPWLKLKGTGRFVGDPFAPVVRESDIEALK
jgi:prevent-host-death family protein